MNGTPVRIDPLLKQRPCRFASRIRIVGWACLQEDLIAVLLCHEPKKIAEHQVIEKDHRWIYSFRIVPHTSEVHNKPFWEKDKSWAQPRRQPGAIVKPSLMSRVSLNSSIRPFLPEIVMQPPEPLLLTTLKTAAPGVGVNASCPSLGSPGKSPGSSATVIGGSFSGAGSGLRTGT